MTQPRKRTYAKKTTKMATISRPVSSNPIKDALYWIGLPKKPADLIYYVIIGCILV